VLYSDPNSSIGALGKDNFGRSGARPIARVYEALQQRENMKSMVQAESSSSKAKALEV
jgi:hypothetical protein